MKRYLAIILAAMLVLCSSLTAFAENADTNTSQPPQMGDGVTEGMPPEMPEGGFPRGPGGTPPEKPDGQPGGPGRPGGAPGNVPGRQQSHTEGQLGSWSMGGTNEDGIEGDDYAYDAALYVTADGINEEKSITDRIASGAYDDQSASGIVISDSESGHNGILVYNIDYTISDAEITMLEKELPDWKRYAEQLSFYMKSTGKKYQNHAATIQSWANRDKEEEKTKKSWKNKDYSYKEGESL